MSRTARPNVAGVFTDGTMSLDVVHDEDPQAPDPVERSAPEEVRLPHAALPAHLDLGPSDSALTTKTAHAVQAAGHR